MQRKKWKRLFIICYSFALLFLTVGISTSFSFVIDTNSNDLVNANLEKNISEEKFISSYEDFSSNITPVYYDNFLDAVNNSVYFATSFTGKLTHYGPDCALCGGHLGCNGQDARNGNIYYDDPTYGTLRIVATSQAIPCGSILRINVPEYDNMYVIVLDRGVSYGIVDLLKESETAYSPVRTLNNIVFDIVRYGY